MTRRFPYVLAVVVALLGGCDDGGSMPMADGGVDSGWDGAVTGDLRINEVVSDNDGVWVDELGEADDWIEIVNVGSELADLRAYAVSDGSNAPVRLPNETLAPGEMLLLWADKETGQGARHLPFGISASGDEVVLSVVGGRVVDHVDVPALPINESFARLPDGTGTFVKCRYATPGRENGTACEPPPPPSLPDNVKFKAYDWPEPWPPETSKVRITELALHPAAFVEILNAAKSSIALSNYHLRVAVTAPGEAMPGAEDGVEIALPETTLAAGARVAVSVTEDDVAELVASDGFDGVVTVFDGAGAVVDRVTFMRWPTGAALTRQPDDAGPFIFCGETTAGETNDECEPVTAREVGDRLHYLRTAGDFDALAEGGAEVGEEAVKFVVDMEAGDTVHLLGTARWALHYTFIRERIYGEPPLDRCDPVQDEEFDQGWQAFSQSEYFRVDGRRFLLGTLVRHAGGLHTMEFAGGDAISGAQMRRAFFAVASHTENPKDWYLRPANSSQLARMKTVDGTVPMVGPNAPFENVSYQPLTQGTGYGVLSFIPSEELETAALGPHTIVVTDGVPNDIPFVGGLVTEAFQTPLAHINVLSRARGTPNMALRHARDHARLAPFLGELVRIDVGPLDFAIRVATPEEADAFWTEHQPDGTLVVPPADTSVRGIQDLTKRGFGDLPAIGAKAAQFAELYKIDKPMRRCAASSVPLHVPRDAFAIPVVYYFEHLASSGAEALLAELMEDPAFRADPAVHEAGLAAVREKILTAKVSPKLLAAAEKAVQTRFGTTRVRFRSSSNVEDLPTFNGAGLHTSVSAVLGDETLSVANAIRAVWASLFNTRAFDEREFAHIDQGRAAMAILVHEASEGEAAQGVAISRNMLDVTRGDIYYINAQVGEASVTNPAPGVATEQLLYTLPPRTPDVTYQSVSSLTGGEPVLSMTDIRNVACAVGAVHDHFRPLLDPDEVNRMFTMQIEFKIERDTRQVVVKQARPQPIDGLGLPTDCREF